MEGNSKSARDGKVTIEWKTNKSAREAKVTIE